MDFESFFSNVCKDFEKNRKVKETSDRFILCATNVQKVSFVSNLKVVQAQLKDITTALKTSTPIAKSKDLSIKARSQGNEWFKKKQWSKALKCYSKSILLAPTDCGVELSLAFANRSATLSTLEHWMHCIRDIELAFAKGYPQDLHHKLFERKGNCWLKLEDTKQALKSFKQAKECLQYSNSDSLQLLKLEKNLSVKMESLAKATDSNNAIEISMAMIEKQIEKTKKDAPKLDTKTNPLLACASSSVQIAYSEGKGRHLIATDDLKPGTTIIVEKAFSSVLLGEFKESHCHHCLQWTVAPIPCENCSQVGFCSATCRDEAWKGYHNLECGFTDFLNNCNVGKHGLLAFRTLTKLGNVRKLLPALNEPMDVGPSCMETLYDSSSYLTVYHLITNGDQRSVADIFRRTIMAVYLASIWHCLRGDDVMDECVAAVFLQHLQNFPCNAHGISQLCLPITSELSPAAAYHVQISEAHLNDVAAAAYPCLSLINHSCDPNVVRNCYGDVAVVTVIRTIHRQEEILDNYGYHYATHSTEERSVQLRKQYYFCCGCEPCLHQWPLYDQIQNHTNNKEVMASSTIFQRHLEQFMSFSCQVDVISLEQMSRHFSRHISLLDQHGVKPFKEYNDAQEALKQCLALVAPVYYQCNC